MHLTIYEITTVFDFVTDVIEILLIGWLYWYVLVRRPRS